jgi:hypothetical protein
MAECFSCEIFTPLDQLAQAYGREAFDALAQPTRVAFNAFVGIWGAWVFAVEGALLGSMSVRKIAPQIAVFTLCGVLLLGVDLYWDWFFEPTYEAMNGVSASLVTGATGLDARNLVDMLGLVEDQIWQVLKVAGQMIAEAGVTSFGLAIYGAVLALPFLFVWGIFLAFIVEGIFKLLAITAVSPLLIAAAAFRPSRGFAVSGFRVVLGGILTVVFAAVAMGFTMHVMRDFTGRIPLNQNGFGVDISDWAGGQEYWGLILLGFVSVLFHLKAATLAANISGASDGPGAAAAVVTGAFVSVAAVKAATFRTAQTAARGAGKAAEWSHNRIWANAKADAKPATSSSN